MLRPWPHDPSARLVLFVDHLTIPTEADLAAAAAAARADGAAVLRTSALFPTATEVVLEAGFAVIDTLALLKLVLDDGVDRTIESRYGVARPRTHALHRRHHERAAAIDVAAFGPMWGNDTASLRDICAATPVHRARCTRQRRRITGFAVSGAAGDTGYIQRLAVEPEHRRHGYARTLVVDALLWMRRRGFASAYVNTGVTNTAALELYRGLGFTQVDDRLVIAERRLDA
jgi:ribosomal protein S18 acetylase RimI-like enzyme